MRRLTSAVGVALALALPAALVAHILDALLEDDLPMPLTVALAALVYAGAALGGWFVARDRPRLPLLHGALVGLVSVGLIAALGSVRRETAGEDVQALAVPVLLVWGALWGAAGAGVARRRPARTRS